MDGTGLENDLRLLYLDLLALSTTALPSIDRLVKELEASIEQFRALLDKKPKNNESRQAVLSGMPLLTVNFITSLHPPFRP
jgi:nuclear pore complex protein Nup205